MSQQLEFRISARDQASSVVTSVQKKVMDFGKDIGRSIGAALGPIALVTMAIQKISEMTAEAAAKRKDAFDWGADLAASAEKLGVTSEEFQNIQEAADKTGKSVDEVGSAFKMARDLIAQAKAGNLDAARSLEALGINLNELDKIKPEEVLSRIAGAMSTAVTPAEKAAIAVGALGKEAKNLQDVLSKGFDIAGAFVDTEGLTNEEAQALREAQKRQRAKENREKLGLARQQSALDFLENDPEGRRVIGEARRRAIAEKGTFGSMTSGFIPELAKDPRVQAEIERIRKERAAEEERKRKAAEEAARNDPENIARAEALRKEAEARAQREKDEEERKRKEAEAGKDAAKKGPDIKIKKPEVEAVAKTAAVTVSSLRAIGGGLAGEQVGAFDVQQMQLDVQKQMRDLLQDIKGNLKPPTDFSKPVIDGMTDFSGKTGNIGVA